MEDDLPNNLMAPATADKFPIMSLPPEIKFKIVRYLDGSARGKMITTSSAMCSFVNRHKKFLECHKIPIADIRIGISWDSRMFACRIYLSKICSVYFFPTQAMYIEYMVAADKYYVVDRVDDCVHPPLFEKIFDYAHIRRLQLHNLVLQDINLAHLHSLVRQKRIHVEELLIKEMRFENEDDFLTFLSIFKARVLFINELRQEFLPKIISSNVFNKLPRLDALYFNYCNVRQTFWSPASMDFNLNFEKMPRILDTHTTFITDIGVIRKGIQCWWNDELDMDSWIVKLELKWNLSTFRDAIGLPTIAPKKKRLKYHSEARREENILRVFPPSSKDQHLQFWALTTGVIDKELYRAVNI